MHGDELGPTHRILVTGGSGFIGSAFVLDAISRGMSVLNLDALTYAAIPASLACIASNPAYEFVQGDITDQELVERLLTKYRPHKVAHFAAESHVDRSITDAAAFIRTNVIGTHTLVEATLRYWESLDAETRQSFRFLHVSTDEVFGSLGAEGLFSETTAYDPRSPYSASKASSDHLVRAWGHTFGLPIVVSNCSNNYGPRQFPEKLIPLTILNALERKPLPVYGDGSNVRDWLFVDDHVAALHLMLERAEAGTTYVVGGRAERRNLDVVERICDLVDAASGDAAGGRRELICFVTDRPGHDQRYAIDPACIQGALGWAPAESFESGLARTVDWYLSNADWWRPIRTGAYRGERLGLRRA